MSMIATLVALIATTAASVPAQATVAQQSGGTETIVDIRFHGNYSIADEDLLEAVGIDIGDPPSAATLELIKQRLENYEGVGSVVIRKRYRSMTNTDDVVLLILIDEHVGVTEKFMFLPVFTWTDEYGVTYGARFTWIDVLGINEHLSIPLTPRRREARRYGPYRQGAPTLQMPRRCPQRHPRESFSTLLGLPLSGFAGIRSLSRPCVFSSFLPITAAATPPGRRAWSATAGTRSSC